MTSSAPPLLEEGWAALRAGDGATARRVFERAVAVAPTAEALEGLARARYLELAFPEAIEAWERAYAAYRDAGDRLGAVRVAGTLAPMYALIVGNVSAMRGWLARAQTLLGHDRESPERGWVWLNLGKFEGDRRRKDELFEEALGVARASSDADLEFAALAYLGASLVHSDHTEEGMLLLDETLAAVAGGEVDDFFILEEIFCQLLSACEHAHDVRRADDWMRVGDAIAKRRNLPSVAAFCHTHYGGVLTAAGRWPEADAALTEAVRLWELGQKSTLRRGALVRLADLRVRQGRIEEAQHLLEDLGHEPEAARSLAAVQLSRGELALARDTLERALQSLDELDSAAAPLLALLVDVNVTENAVVGASDAAARLAACADRHPSHLYLRAAAALAQGRVCLASGSGDPTACLRDALDGFARAEMPVELARCRLELAMALASDHPEVALAEARAALDAFERLQVAREVDAAAALLRSLGVRPASPKRSGEPLTKRETEVLELLGHGLSNPEIGDRLYISRKTVEHHVGNVLAKLGLRSRAEAAAYAARSKPGEK